MVVGWIKMVSDKYTKVRFNEMKTQKVIICRGNVASGKSTWSKQWIHDHPEYKRINRDDLRFMLYNEEWSIQQEDVVLVVRKVIIKELLRMGYNLVLDDTNLVPWRLHEIELTIQIIGKELDKEIEIEFKDFTDVPLETCLARNALRPDPTRVPEKFIRDYHEKYIKDTKANYDKTVKLVKEAKIEANKFLKANQHLFALDKAE